MGDYLSAPIKDKEIVDGENSRVTAYSDLVHRYDLELVECKDGARIWKMPMYSSSI